jgi:intracellular sulfur oxidation DsrE/DsrF family protein
MKKITCILSLMFALAAYGQKQDDNGVKKVLAQRDSTLRVTMHADSVKINKEFDMKRRIAKIKPTEIYPVFNAGDGSGVIPVKDRTEIPDSTMDYKLLFEIPANNPDSTVGEINRALVEVARVINLHVASGIPLKRIFPVIIMHGSGIRVVTTNGSYKERYKTDNPNIKLVNQMSDLGVRFIICGQSMTYGELNKDKFLPQVKISLTAQTVLSSYQLKGYVKYTEN